MHASKKCCGELAELTVDDIWQITDAGDQELRRLAHSSWRGTLTSLASNDSAQPLAAQSQPQLGMEVSTGLFHVASTCGDS